MKYSHNASAYTQVIMFNVMYDLARANGLEWDNIREAVEADPFISNRYARPVHKTGRGAGGHCFIKDMAALREMYERALPADKAGSNFLRSLEAKNIDLLIGSNKDLDLLRGVYGDKPKSHEAPHNDAGGGPRRSRLGFFHRWIVEIAKRCDSVHVICLKEGRHQLPANVTVHSLGKEGGTLSRQYVTRFYRYIWRYRKEYDSVFVHMNSEYVCLGGPALAFVGQTGRPVAQSQGTGIYHFYSRAPCEYHLLHLVERVRREIQECGQDADRHRHGVFPRQRLRLRSRARSYFSDDSTR